MKNVRREPQRLGGKSWGGWGALVSPLIMRVAGCTSRWSKGDNRKKGKLGGYRKVKLFPGQCCVFVVYAVPAARACLGARNPGGVDTWRRADQMTRSQGKAIAANEGAVSRLLFRVSVVNVELWGVTVIGWRKGCSTKCKRVEEELESKSTVDQPFLRCVRHFGEVVLHFIFHLLLLFYSFASPSLIARNAQT